VQGKYATEPQWPLMVMVMVMVPPGRSFALDMTDMVFMWCSTFLLSYMGFSCSSGLMVYLLEAPISTSTLLDIQFTRIAWIVHT
jgi:hypothetical protein